ncbi:hypothetical protein Ciccas_008741 [Cichlidogyrus casuarinus]|uniref:Uncharacterized protein n=1 Tax=Cichlidogyrus casuarinus TaxID=1844966 RepID=A0ABD2PZ41_9PLAT
MTELLTDTVYFLTGVDLTSSDPVSAFRSDTENDSKPVDDALVVESPELFKMLPEKETLIANIANNISNENIENMCQICPKAIERISVSNGNIDRSRKICLVCKKVFFNEEAEAIQCTGCLDQLNVKLAALGSLLRSEADTRINESLQTVIENDLTMVRRYWVTSVFLELFGMLQTADAVQVCMQYLLFDLCEKAEAEAYNSIIRTIVDVIGEKLVYGGTQFYQSLPSAHHFFSRFRSKRSKSCVVNARDRSEEQGDATIAKADLPTKKSLENLDDIPQPKFATDLMIDVYGHNSHRRRHKAFSKYAK